MKKYPPRSAGAYLCTKVPLVNENSKLRDVSQLIEKRAKDFETINYIYVVDDENILKGVFSIKELFKNKGSLSVLDLANRNLVYVFAHSHQEKVAMLALKNSLKAIPVLSKEKKFLGVVASDDVIKILDQEATDNLLRISGVSESLNIKENIFTLPIIKSIKNRLPWLIIGLIGGILTAGVVSQFEAVLSKNIILAAFIPLIVYMSDAVGTQMQAFIIRDLSLNSKLNFLKYLLRQAAVVLIMALIISTLLFLISFSLYQSISLSFILASALFLAIVSSLFTGLIVPYTFSRFKFDPADVSGPIATIIQDILSILVYFFIANLIL